MREISETCRVGIDDGLQKLIEVIDDGFSENCPVTTTWVSEVALLNRTCKRLRTSSSGEALNSQARFSNGALGS
jgi:hypothetical protein